MMAGGPAKAVNASKGSRRPRKREFGLRLKNFKEVFISFATIQAKSQGAVAQYLKWGRGQRFTKDRAGKGNGRR
jgi:hypothetical protein